MSIDTNFSGAVSRAYQAGQSLPVARSAESGIGKVSFSDLVEEVGRSTIQTVHQGNNAVLAGLRGTMPTQQVVEATQAMETALQVTVAVRNKVVEAYTEILRMSV